MSKINGYNSKEKLKSRKALEWLFAKGKSFSVFPIKVFYTVTEMALEAISDNVIGDNNGTDDHAKVAIYNTTTELNLMVNAGVGVSARNFKKAVERNRIKRLLREVYRTQKQQLLSTAKNKQIHINAFFLYIGKEMPMHDQLNTSMEKLLQKFQEKISKDQTSVSQSNSVVTLEHADPAATNANGTTDSVNDPAQ